MKQTKHFLRPLLMAIVMMVGMLMPQNVWALGGSGTSSSPYTIEDAYDLWLFFNKVNRGETNTNAKLTADIVIDGTYEMKPIGTSSSPYTGTFDGQGHKISGLSLTATAANAGLFGYVNGATIKNFTLAGTVSSAYDNTGSVVGTANGSTKIYNVYSSVNITMTAAKNHIGGIMGQALQVNDKTVEIKGCTYSGTMNLGSSTDSNGGIVGYCYINANIEIENCLFSGSISSTGSNPRIGGILGYADDDGNTQNFKYIRNCFCDGTLSPSTGNNVGIFAGYPRGKVKDVISNNTYVSTASTNMAGNSTQTTAANNGCKKITISVTAGSNGTVSKSYVNPTTSAATQLQVVATPNAHYHLNKWSDNGAQTHNVGLTDNVSLSASFAIDQHTISVATNNANYGTVSGGGTFDYNSTKTITATPKTHYHLKQWNDGNTSTSRQITVTEDKTYTATFEIDQHTITLKTNDSNMGTVSGGGTFDYGSTKTITATPKTGYHFVKWSDDNTNASRTITVSANATYTANFAAHTYGDVVWTWASDGSSASAKITCTACGNVLSGNAAITSKVKTAATCTVKGTTTYTAKVTLNNREYTATKDIQDIAVLGHDFTSQTPTATYVKSNATCTDDAVYYHKCSQCDAKGTTYWTHEGSALGHDYAAEYTIDVEATCTEDGSKSKHCSRCESTTDVTAIPAVGHHTFSDDDLAHGVCTTCNHGFFRYTSTDNVVVNPHFAGQLKDAYDNDLTIISNTNVDGQGVIEFNKPLVRIGPQAFDGCKDFTGNLILPNSITSIGAWAFEGCSDFSGDLVIPESVTSIGFQAFNGCSGFTGSLTIGKSVREIENLAFDNTNFTSLNMASLPWLSDFPFGNPFNFRPEFEEKMTLTLTDNSYIYTGNESYLLDMINGTYTRNIKNEWGTIVVPFMIGNSSEYDIYTLTDVSETYDELTLTKINEPLAPATPAIFHLKEAPASTGVDITFTATSKGIGMSDLHGSEAGGLQLVGTFEVTELDWNDYIIANNKFWLVADVGGAFSGPFRAYLHPTTYYANARAFSIAIEEEANAIKTLNAITDGTAEYYDMDGRRIPALQKGVNIVKYGNGKTIKVNIK